MTYSTVSNQTYPLPQKNNNNTGTQEPVELKMYSV